MFKEFLIRIRNKVLATFGDIKINKHLLWIPYYKPQGYRIRGEHARKLIEICKPGDVLLRGYTDYLDGLFIGKWSHVGIVLNATQVIHSMADGVIIEDMLNFFRTDRVCVLRPDLEKENLRKALGKAEGLKGTPYDFGFDFNNPREVSCSEFVYLCFEKFKEELGMFKETEKFLFIKKIIIRPGAFLKFVGFKQITELP